MMKNAVALLFLLISISSNSQDYKKFSTGIGVGCFGGMNQYVLYGGLIFIEPYYRLSDRISVSAKAEFAREVNTYYTNTIGSYSINGQYYFGKRNFHPFAGIGFGVYSTASTSSYMAVSDDYPTVMGVSPRIGFRSSHLLFMFEYNFTRNSFWRYNYNGIDEVLPFDVDYLSAKVGLLIGGGRKKS